MQRMHDYVKTTSAIHRSTKNLHLKGDLRCLGLSLIALQKTLLELKFLFAGRTFCRLKVSSHFDVSSLKLEYSRMAQQQTNLTNIYKFLRTRFCCL